MSDIPTKTYPPEFLRAMIADHEAEQAGATPEECSAVDTREDAMGEDLVNLAKRWPDRVATHYDGCEATHVGCLVKKLAREVERLTAERDEAQAEVERLTKQRGDAMSDTPIGWQPIESAPRDGTWILLWDDRACGAVSGYWDADVDEWMTDVDVCDGDFLPTLWLSVPHPTLCDGGRDE